MSARDVSASNVSSCRERETSREGWGGRRRGKRGGEGGEEEIKGA